MQEIAFDQFTQDFYIKGDEYPIFEFLDKRLFAAINDLRADPWEYKHSE